MTNPEDFQAARQFDGNQQAKKCQGNGKLQQEVREDGVLNRVENMRLQQEVILPELQSFLTSCGLDCRFVDEVSVRKDDNGIRSLERTARVVREGYPQYVIHVSVRQMATTTRLDFELEDDQGKKSHAAGHLPSPTDHAIRQWLTEQLLVAGKD